MKIKIAHLYYNLLNLYGEQGNVLALKKALIKQDAKVEVDLLTIGDKIDFKKYDIFYFGSGSNENLLLVLDDIKKYTKEIEKAIKKGKYFIATGNAYELFGEYIKMNNQKYETLGIFKYHAEESPKRIVGENFLQFEDLSPIIGFNNHSCNVTDITNPLFKVLGNNEDEGYHEDNFFGTHLIGPLLIRNPHLTDYIVKDIMGKKYQPRKVDIEDKAYEEYLKNFY